MQISLIQKTCYQCYFQPCRFKKDLWKVVQKFKEKKEKKCRTAGLLASTSDPVHRPGALHLGLQHHRLDGHADRSKQQGHHRGTLQDDRLFPGELYHTGPRHALRKQYVLSTPITSFILMYKRPKWSICTWICWFSIYQITWNHRRLQI